jgi:hypothetical protein
MGTAAPREKRDSPTERGSLVTAQRLSILGPSALAYSAQEIHATSAHQIVR